MICPFRKEIITIKAEDTKSTKEIYCDCYENECPYYYRYNFDNNEGCHRTEEDG